MENEDEKVISETTPSQEAIELPKIHSPDHNRDRKSISPPAARSPGDLPAESSVSSGDSSLRHGLSPKETKVSTPPLAKAPPPVTVVNRFDRDEPAPETVTEADPGATGGHFVGSAEEGGGGGDGGGGGSGRKLRSSLSILKKAQREKMVKKAALGFRIFGLLFCLISFSVMAADRSQGWALDSFDRYKEFRYCMSMNVIGFVYSGAQVYSMAYHLATGKYVVRNQLRYYFDFAIDQMLTYLLISASSSAATRVDDWITNWGEDTFPNMATASLSMSFLAFVAFAFSSLISGCALCTYNSM